MPTRTPGPVAIHGAGGPRAWMVAATLAASALDAPTLAQPAAHPGPAAVAPETLRVPAPVEAHDVDERAHARRFEPLADLNRGARNYLSDAWHIYSAPARMGWREAAILGGVVAAGGALYVKDDEIYEKIRAHDREDAYGAWIDWGHTLEPIGFMGDTNPIYAGSLALGYTLSNTVGLPGADWVATVSAELLQSHLTAGAFRQVGEIFVGRERPFDTEDAYEFDDGTSFPSGHASVICEVAVVTSHHVGHPVYTALAYGTALAVCLQRVDSGNHWPSDTWAGMAYGTFVAREVVRRNEERRARDRASRRDAVGAAPRPRTGPRWTPSMEGRGFGLAVHARF